MARLIVNNYGSLKINKDEKTLVCVVDMVNGFVKLGAMSDIEINKITPNIINLLSKDFNRIFITDNHDKNCIEFKSFPIHCLAGTEESEIIDELKLIMNKDDKVYKKNSTNFFHLLQETGIVFEDYDNIIIVGCCTDICVMQFALSLKTYFNQIDKLINVIIPVNCVDTYNAPDYHEAEYFNDVALRIMEQAGIKVVSTIE